MGPAAITPEHFATFGELLKYLRRQARLTQAELALAVGYSDAQISRMEKDERIPDPATITALFVPALDMGHQPHWVERLVDLAEAAHAAEAVQKAGETRTEEPSTPPHNLPVRLTSFIGREKEISAALTLFNTHRLVTILGPGGIGKTRFSFQVAQELLDTFPQGIRLVEFAPLSDPALVTFALANSLGLREAGEPNTPILELMTNYLRRRRTLLLFDNCEHLVEAVARLAESLLQECEGVSILATSREALRVDGEVTYRLPPLVTPPAEADMDTLLGSEAVRLFVERAREAEPGFEPEARQAAAIAKICQRLDGIPLALELAAARVRMMTVDEISVRLNDRFGLLTGGARTSLPRQKALRASIDWSYNLLPAEEQAVFVRLAVFAGGWTLEAMEAVCTGEGPRETAMVDLAGELVDKSLLMVDQGESGTRYHMLETIREYARERLAKAGEETRMHNKHLDYYLRLAEEAEPELQRGEQQAWFDRLEREKDNLRAAIEWSLKSNQIEKGLRVGSALLSFWDNKGHWSEGYERLAALLAQRQKDKNLVQAKALVTAGNLASECGYSTEMQSLFDEGIGILNELGEKGHPYLGFALAEYAKAFIDRDVRRGRGLAEEAIRTSREANDPVGLAYSLWVHAMMTRRVSDFEAAREAEEESLSLFKELGNQSYVTLLMSNLAWTFYFQGDLKRAGEYFDLSMNIAREIGDRYSETNSTPGRADIFRRSGDYEQAEKLLLRGLAFHREIGSAHQGLVNHLHILGLLELTRGNHLQAAEYLREGVRAAGKGNLLHFLRFVIDAMAYLAAETEPRRSARLFGGADMLRGRLGTPLYPVERQDHDHYWTLAKEQVPQAEWEMAWNEGRSMTMEQLIGLALENS